MGERFELGRYTVCGDERVLYGERVRGKLRVIDGPACGRGRSFLVEWGLDPEGYRALRALIADYVSQAALLQAVPMAGSVLRHVQQLESSDAGRWAA